MKKLTIEFVRGQFEKDGYTLLTKEYINSRQKLEYTCPKGHKASIKWNNWQQGDRCLKCSKNKKLTIEFVRGQFEKDGYTLLTKEYINAYQKLKYICPKEHRDSISWRDWGRGVRCAKCAGNKKLTIEFIKEQFVFKGYTLLTKEYINSRQKLDYICPKGHRGSICWYSWHRGCRCVKCSNMLRGYKRRLTIDFVSEEFKKAGYTLLTKEYINAKQKLEYICPNGHYGNICWANWRQGQRCAKCFGNKKLTIDFIKKEFEKNNYILLSNEYNNAHDKLDYICPKGHKGSILWKSWAQGHRCSECAGNKKLTIEFIREQFEKDGYILLTNKYVNAFQKLEYICPKGHRGKITRCNWIQGNRCKRCWLENNKGKNHPSWNPNKTDEERMVERHIPGYSTWRNTIKERDNFTCQICNQQGGNLVSHHLEAYATNPELRIELSNGITLCKTCHNRFHSKYGWGNNTKEQFEEFKIDS